MKTTYLNFRAGNHEYVLARHDESYLELYRCCFTGAGPSKKVYKLHFMGTETWNAVVTRRTVKLWILENGYKREYEIKLLNSAFYLGNGDLRHAPAAFAPETPVSAHFVHSQLRGLPPTPAYGDFQSLVGKTVEVQVTTPTSPFDDPPRFIVFTAFGRTVIMVHSTKRQPQFLSAPMGTKNFLRDDSMRIVSHSGNKLTLSSTSNDHWEIVGFINPLHKGYQRNATHPGDSYPTCYDHCVQALQQALERPLYQPSKQRSHEMNTNEMINLLYLQNGATIFGARFIEGGGGLYHFKNCLGVKLDLGDICVVDTRNGVKLVKIEATDVLPTAIGCDLGDLSHLIQKVDQSVARRLKEAETQVAHQLALSEVTSKLAEYQKQIGDKTLTTISRLLCIDCDDDVVDNSGNSPV